MSMSIYFSRVVRLFPWTTGIFLYFLVTMIVGALLGINYWFGLYCAMGMLPIFCWSDIRDRKRKEAG